MDFIGTIFENVEVAPWLYPQLVKGTRVHISTVCGKWRVIFFIRLRYIANSNWGCSRGCFTQPLRLAYIYEKKPFDTLWVKDANADILRAQARAISILPPSKVIRAATAISICTSSSPRGPLVFWILLRLQSAVLMRWPTATWTS